MILHIIDERFTDCIKWATSNKKNVTKIDGKTIKVQKKEQELRERKWGNSIIGQENNGQWTTRLGEGIVYSVLKQLGENPRIPKSKGGFKPDLETDKYIYEVKTSNWCVEGTAGEKVLATWIKYQDIPELYGKPLRIVCVAKQEYELEYGKINYFGENISQKTKQILNLAREWNIEYIRFSDLVSKLNCKQ